MKIQVIDIRVVMPYSDMVGYQHFGGPSCLHLQGEVKMEAAGSSKSSISYHIIAWHHNPEDHDLEDDSY
jgi:hypothetical protein